MNQSGYATVLTIVVIFGVVLGITTLAILMVRAQFRRAEQLLLTWAEQNGYQIEHKENATPMGTGPLQRSGDKRVMLQVTLRDAAGTERRALFRIGSPSMGTTSDDISVEWEN
jgi:hypothetical protein